MAAAVVVQPLLEHLAQPLVCSLQPLPFLHLSDCECEQRILKSRC